MPRNYKEEYEKYHGSEEQKKRRAQRNAARRAAMRTGKVRKGDNKEVDHRAANRKGPLNNKNVQILTKKQNRKKQPKRDGSED
jgi:hypothetical protein